MDGHFKKKKKKKSIRTQNRCGKKNPLKKMRETD